MTRASIFNEPDILKQCEKCNFPAENLLICNILLKIAIPITEILPNYLRCVKLEDK